MIYYTSVDETGRICATTPFKEYSSSDMFEFEFSSDFDFSTQYDYRIVNEKLVHEPAPLSKEQIEQEQMAKYHDQLETATVMFIRKNAANLSDKDALSTSMLFDIWKPDVKYVKGDIVRYKQDIYRIGQDHASQVQWVPGEQGTTALYSLINIDDGGYEVWKQWDGVSGIYQQGQIVRNPDDGKLYKSKIPNNTWGPPHKEPTMWEQYDA